MGRYRHDANMGFSAGTGHSVDILRRRLKSEGAVLDDGDPEEWRQTLSTMGVANMSRKRGYGNARRHSVSNPRNIDVALRRAKALELRRAGYSYEEISRVKSLGYTGVAQVSKDMQRLFQQMLDEPAKDVLALELSRLEAVIRYLWQQVRNGDLPAMDRLFHAMKIKHNLLGLNRPIQHQMVSSDTMDAEIQRLTGELQGMDQPKALSSGALSAGGSQVLDGELVSAVEEHGYDMDDPDDHPSNGREPSKVRNIRPKQR